MEEEKKKREEEKKKQDEEAQALESVHSKLKDVRREGGREGGGRREGGREGGRVGGWEDGRMGKRGGERKGGRAELSLSRVLSFSFLRPPPRTDSLSSPFFLFPSLRSRHFTPFFPHP
jgi:hypothetical protein